MFHPQITAASALINLVTPTRTGAPHQPMMSPRTAWRRALQEHGNRINAVQKSISFFVFDIFEKISLTIFKTDSMCARSQTKIMVELLSKLHLKLTDAKIPQRVLLNVGQDGLTRDPVATFLIPQR